MTRPKSGFENAFEIHHKDFQTTFEQGDNSRYNCIMKYGKEFTPFDEEIATSIIEIIRNADDMNVLSMQNTRWESLQQLYQDCKISKSDISEESLTQHKKNPFNDHEVPTINIFEILGQYYPNCGPNIVIDLDKIYKEYEGSIVVLTVLHELMHAAMEVNSNPDDKDNGYWYYKEEAYANAFALKILKCSKHQDWFKKAYDFVRNQPKGYNAGAILVDEDISIEYFRQEKRCPKSVSEDMQENWMSKYIN